jgi:cytidine deaminase
MFNPLCTHAGGFFILFKNLLMEQRQHNFSFEVFASIDELASDDAMLLAKAREATSNAYAPYSNFHVAAAAVLSNGEIITGTNQENASYPVGICAERTLLSAASSLFPNVGIVTMAITYNNTSGNSNTPASPCGMCRQALVEHEERTHQPMRLILSGANGEVYVIAKASELLPLSFGKKDLR